MNNQIFDDKKQLFEDLLTNIGANKYFTEISVLVEISDGKTYRFSKSGTSIKDNMFATSGAVLRLQTPDGPYEYSFNNFSKDFLNSIPAILADETGFSDNTGSLKRSEDRITFCKSTDFEIDPDKLDDAKITKKLEQAHKKAREYDALVTDCTCVYQYLGIHKMFLSCDKNMEQHILWSVGTATPFVTKDDVTRYYYSPCSALGGAEILDNLTDNIETSCKNAIELLDSVPPVPGTYDVICTPDVTGLIAHEAFGHGVEEDMFVKDRALAKKYMNTQIASPLVTMHDNAATINQAATYFFDDEGTLSHDTIIIKDGILVSGINDAQSAAALGFEPTGNGRRESFERKVYTRMTNTYFESGSSTLDEMIASIEYGFLLDNGMNGMEDPKNWGIQCMVNIGREIKDGKFTGKIVSPVCLSGYVPDLLKSVSMVSDTLKLSGSGYCGKGYKEWVKVSDGGPAIKARVKIS